MQDAKNFYGDPSVRWFKHLSVSNSDEKLAKLIDMHGLEGYGFYWILLETLAKEMDLKRNPDKTFLEYSVRKWSQSCNLSSTKLRKFCNSLSTLGLITLKENGKYLKIDCPNLLKYKDEYSKKSRQAQDKVPTDSGQTPRQERERERERKTDKPPKSPLKILSSFLEFVEAYPPSHRIGENEAKEIWAKTNQVERMQIVAQVKKYFELRWKPMIARGEEKYIPNMDSFLKKSMWKAEPLAYEKNKDPFARN